MPIAAPLMRSTRKYPVLRIRSNVENERRAVMLITQETLTKLA